MKQYVNKGCLLLLALALFACREDKVATTTQAQGSQEQTIQLADQTQATDQATSDDKKLNSSLSALQEDRQANCPKLVQKRVDRAIVSRQDSILSRTCDYFIYPNVGDVVSVSVSDDRLKPTLHSPYYHDFANGSYEVVSNGRHVIRLQYDAFGRRPLVLDYTIEVGIFPAS